MFAQSYGFNYSYLILIILRQIFSTYRRNPTGTTTPSQSGPRSNGSERKLHTPQSTITGASPPDTVLYHTQETPFLSRWVLSLCRGGYSQCIPSPANRVLNNTRQLLIKTSFLKSLCNTIFYDCNKWHFFVQIIHILCWSSLLMI